MIEENPEIATVFKYNDGTYGIKDTGDTVENFEAYIFRDKACKVISEPVLLSNRKKNEDFY